MFEDDDDFTVDDELALAEQILFVSAATVVMTATLLAGLVLAFLRGWIPSERDRRATTSR